MNYSPPPKNQEYLLIDDILREDTEAVVNLTKIGDKKQKSCFLKERPVLLLRLQHSEGCKRSLWGKLYTLGFWEKETKLKMFFAKSPLIFLVQQNSSVGVGWVILL